MRDFVVREGITFVFACAVAHRQHLEVGLEDVKPLGSMPPQGAVAPCECAEWTPGSDASLGPGCPGALPTE